MARRTGYWVLAGVAIVVQVLLVFQFFVMGLGWGGAWYVANLVQAALLLVIAVVLVRKRPLLVLPLPVLSLLLMLLFQAVDPSTKTTDCTDVELAAAAQLPAPPSTPSPVFQSEPANGCIARFETALSAAQLLDHYRAAAQQAGWEVEEPGEVQSEPGQPEPELAGGLLLGMSSESVAAAVSYERAGDEGPARNRLWVVIELNQRER
jgi:hypothetical protein